MTGPIYTHQSNAHVILLVQVDVVEESLRDLQHRVDVFDLARVALVSHVDQRHLKSKGRFKIHLFSVELRKR